MRHTIHEVIRVSNLTHDEFKRYWMIVGSENVHNACQYAMKLSNEAGLQLSKIKRFQLQGGQMTPELGEAAELFECQRNYCEKFLDTARRTGLLQEIKIPLSKRRAKELIENITQE